MSEIINQLQIDHNNIARLLGLLADQTSCLEAGEYTDLQLVSDIMHYFVNYPDIQHHPLEDLVFAALKERDAGVTDIIEDIHAEHKSMALESVRIQETITQMQGNAIYSREKIVTALKNYIDTYYAHMEKEETGLFSPADKILNEMDWTKIKNQIRLVDDPLFGKILNDQYTSLYKVILSEVPGQK